MKNDAQDAEAICEAASRPQMRFVPIKSPAQQSVLVLHRMRTGFVEERTALVNRLRGLLAEFGVFLPQGIRSLHKHLVDRLEDGSNELGGPARQALMRGWAQCQVLDQEIACLDKQIAEHAVHDEQAQRCMEVCGVGPLTASAAVATVVNARQFKNGRQMAAWIGTVPRQNSSGGKQRLGRITRQGNDYLRTLLYQGARSAILLHRDASIGSRAGSFSCRPASAITRPWSPSPTSMRAFFGPCSRRARNSIHHM